MNPTQIVEIRIPSNLGDTLKKATDSQQTRESVAFALTSHITLENKTILLVRKVISLPENAYFPSSSHGAKWSGRAMLPILNEAINSDLGVAMFHSHFHNGPVRLSPDDCHSAKELLPLFQNIVPSRPHASVVFGFDYSAGLILMPDRESYIDSVTIRWLGKVIRDFPSKKENMNPYNYGNIYHRQILMIKNEGQSILHNASVAVVGLSGGGSHVVQQLAHMGVGNIFGIDGDRADQTNRSRMIGLKFLDAFLKRKKTSVMARMVRKINRGVHFTAIPYPVPDQRSIVALKKADLIVGCVDNLHTRADIQDIAWRYLIPYVDIGLIIKPHDDGTGVSVAGNVHTLIPGEYCLWCAEFLTEEKLLKETGGRPRSYFQGTDSQAQVVSFNGVLASQAVNEVLQLLIGFAPANQEMSIKKFNGIEGTLEKWIVKKKINCPKCLSVQGAGDIIWRKI